MISARNEAVLVCYEMESCARKGLASNEGPVHNTTQRILYGLALVVNTYKLYLSRHPLLAQKAAVFDRM